MTEIKKVVIPKFVAEFLGSHWEDGEPPKEDKADLIRHQEQYIRSFGTSELKNWIVKADNFICRSSYERLRSRKGKVVLCFTTLSRIYDKLF